MPNDPVLHAAQADAIADGVCRRRLTHAGLTLLAAWLSYLALARGESSLLPEVAGRTLAMFATASALAFAGWTLLIGDRLVWRRAFREASTAAHPADDARD